MERDGGSECGWGAADDRFEKGLRPEGHDLASSSVGENAAKGTIVSDGGVAEFHRACNCSQTTIAAVASIKCGGTSFLDVWDA